MQFPEGLKNTPFKLENVKIHVKIDRGRVRAHFVALDIM